VVIIKIVKEPPAQYHGLLAGEIDIACSVPRTTIRDLVEKGFKVINVSTFHNFVLFFNTKRYPTNISYFRLAIAYALNLTEIVQVAVYGFALEASGVIPHGFPGHVEGLKYNHNLETSKKYLEFSGVKMPIKIELLYQVDYEETRKFAELFKSRMSELGIEVELNPQDWARLKDIAKGVWTSPESTPHLILADWWPTMPSPFDYLYAMFHSESKEWNFAGYENPEFDSLIEEALTLEGVNYTRALELYKDAQILLFEEAVAVGLWDEIRPFTYSSRIEMPQEALNPMYTFVIRFELVSVRS
jgi:peptide/nickel transport system substrate-binding protein